MEYSEEDYLPLSGIQHYLFCKRQWALIHIEQQWEDNRLTTEGNLLHKKAHDSFSHEKRGDILIARGLKIHSRQMGLSGECDVVEFLATENGVTLHGHQGFYRPYPVEYKKGHPKTSDADIAQLAAQAMCLEEMFSIPVREGALYYGELRKRETVVIDEGLRNRIQGITFDMHRMFESKHTPQVRWKTSCNACSLKERCLPKLEKANSVEAYIDRFLQETGK